MYQVALAKAFEVLDKWLKDNGLVVIERGQGYIVYKEGNNIVMCRGLYLDIPNEGDVAKEIAIMAKDRHIYNKYYIVTTHEVVAFIDGSLMRKLGIGVLVVDDGEVKEILRSIPIETATQQPINNDKVIALENSIKALETKVRELEERVNQLTQAINELRQANRRQPTLQTQQPQPQQASIIKTPENVPSFIKDNPWLGILMNKAESNS